MFHKVVFDFFLLQADQIPPWCGPTSSASIPDPETLRSGSQNDECPDMIFVKDFTQPDFQAKSFTPQKCIICDIFFRKLTA